LGKSKSYDTWEGLVKKRELKKSYEDLEEKVKKTKLLFNERDNHEDSLLNYNEPKNGNNSEISKDDTMKEDDSSRSEESVDEDYDDDDIVYEAHEDVAEESLNSKINEILQNVKKILE
jgi:hypothetical protein